MSLQFFKGNFKKEVIEAKDLVKKGKFNFIIKWHNKYFAKNY